MKHPYVEAQQSRWRFETIYYDPTSNYVETVKPTESRADLDHMSVIFSDVILEVAELGGDTEDIANAALYRIAYLSTSMEISKTPRLFEFVGRLWGLEAGEELSERLGARAEELLSGAALVGTLRAIAWHLSRTTTSMLRRSLAAAAREENRRCELVSGAANLSADDAHAHLDLAGRLKPGNNELRTRLLVNGIAFLGAANALALLEPWNPFVLHRVQHETADHAGAVEEVLTLLPELADQTVEAAQQLDAVHAQSASLFAEATQKHGGDDIAAYFAVRDRAPGRLATDELCAGGKELCELEPNLARLI